MEILLKNSIAFFILSFFSPLFSYAQHDTTKANILLEKALDFYDDGNYKTARKPFQKALALRKKHYPAGHIKVEDLYYWMGSNEQSLRVNEKALFYFNKGLEVAIRRKGPQSIAVADFYMDIGNTYDQMYKVDIAKTYYQKALIIFEKEYGAKSSAVGNTYMNIGYGQRKMGNYHDSGQYYKKAFEIFQQSSEPTSKDFYRIYINQCNLLYDLGNYDRALEFAEKALTIKLMHYDTLHPSVYKYFGNIGNIYHAKGMLKEALPYAKKALYISEKTRGKNHPETAGLLGTLADLYADMGQLDKALRLQKKSVKIQEKGLSPTHPYLIAGYHSIGRIYEDKMEYDKALDFYEEAIEKYQAAAYVPRHLIANTLNRIAKVHFTKGDIQEALLITQKGIQHIAPTFSFEASDFYKNPVIAQVQAEVAFLDLLRSKAYFLEASYKKRQQQEALEQALKTSELAISLIEKIRRSYQSEAAREFLNSDTAPIYEQAVEQAFELYQLTQDVQFLLKAFELSEKSKASILWQSINDQYALKASGIPSAELDSIAVLAQKISSLENDRTQSDINTNLRDNINNQLFDLKLIHENRIKGLEKHNPLYYQMKYAPAIVAPSLIQQKISNQETVLLEYFYTPNYLFIFTISKEKTNGVRVPLSLDLHQAIIELRQNNIGDLVINQRSSSNYLEQLSILHQLLIAPIQSEIKTASNLIIIPHGVLQFLSFETLSSVPKQDFRTPDYLIKHYDIQYSWSVALWAQRPKKISKGQYKFVGFALNFETDQEVKGQEKNVIFRKSLSPLPYTYKEIESANTYFAGKTFINNAASESQFIEIAPKSQILHMATHAIANDQFPMQSGLIFSNQEQSTEDGFLNASEIYNLDLSADLAVISACDTGFGQLVEGEGAMSLGRAFLYAGCKSVIMSLWLANDESTSIIMQDFYKYTSKGLAKHQALRQAKLDYLSQADPLTAHPYFWANLITVGDMSPIQEKANFHWCWLLLLGGSILFLWFYLKN